MVAGLAIAIAVCVFTKSRRMVVFEIIAIALLIIVVPALVWRLSIYQALEIGNTVRDYGLEVLGAANIICDSVTRLTDVSNVLCYVVCGMSISEKVYSKKSNRNTAQIIE